MNATELRADAEMVLQLSGSGFGRRIDDGWNCAQTVARHVLATIHADDDEPVTVESLEALLGVPDVSGDKFQWYGNEPYYEVTLYVKTGSVLFYAEKPQIDAEPETMGQLRACLRLAGIEVKR